MKVHGKERLNKVSRLFDPLDSPSIEEKVQAPFLRVSVQKKTQLKGSEMPHQLGPLT